MSGPLREGVRKKNGKKCCDRNPLTYQAESKEEVGSRYDIVELASKGGYEEEANLLLSPPTTTNLKRDRHFSLNNKNIGDRKLTARTVATSRRSHQTISSILSAGKRKSTRPMPLDLHRDKAKKNSTW